MSVSVSRYLLVFTSWCLIAFGQPARIAWMGLVASILAYGLFWFVVLDWPSSKRRFFMSAAWFASAHMVQLSWMTSYEYQGYYIFLVLFLLGAGAGLQFAVLTHFVRRPALKSVLSMGAVAGLWVLLEWMRLFLFTGYSLNPVGLALTGSEYSLQLAALVGVYGLSFLVILCNLFSLSLMVGPKSATRWGVWSILVLGPYVFGSWHLSYHEKIRQAEPPTALRAVLVQPALVPRVVSAREGKAYPLLGFQSWMVALELLSEHKDKDVDLIVIPEGFVPYSAKEPVYPIEAVDGALASAFGSGMLASTPEPTHEYVQEFLVDGRLRKFVSNGYWAKTLSNYFQADLVVGLDDMDRSVSGHLEFHNAALLFQPDALATSRYEKQVLLPVAEYIPYDWCRSVAAMYGIHASFTPGLGAKVFKGSSNLSLGLSICYEETFGNLMREFRQQGADILVNITNDVWYPDSSLPAQHFFHSRLRSIENGVPMVRACNTGVTGAVDSLGRIVDTVTDEQGASEWTKKALYVELDTYGYRTLYSQLGDGLIVGISLVLASLAFRLRRL